MASRSISKREWDKEVEDKRTGKVKTVRVVRYRARYRDDTGKEWTRHFERRGDAQRWLDEEAAKLVGGNWTAPDAGKITFAEWFEQWSARQVWTTGTGTSAQQAADSVPFGKAQMRAIRRSHIEQWVKAMTQPAKSRKQGLAASTIRTRFNYVNMALNGAVKDKVIGENPADGVSLPKQRRADMAMTIPTTEQVKTALDAAPASFRAFVAVAAFAGLRLGEAAGLQVGDIDFLRRRISVNRQVQGQTQKEIEVVPPKQGSERVIAVPEALTDLLAEHVRTVGVRGDDRWLFWSPAGGRMTRNAAGNQWRITRDETGLEEFTLHDLRHFYASALIAAGCDVVTVQRALGHASPTITLNTYSHLWPSAEDRTRKAAADLMEEVFSAGIADSEGDSGSAKGS